MDDVVHVQPLGAVTSGDPTASVALLHRQAGAAGHDAGSAPDTDGDAVGVELHLGPGVAGGEAAQAVGQGRSQVHVGSRRALVVGLHVDHHQVAVVVGTGDGLGGQRRLAYGQQGVGPGDLGGPGTEQFLALGAQAPFHQLALVGRQVDAGSPAVVVVVAEADPSRASASGSEPGGGNVLQLNVRRSWATVAERASSAAWASRWVGAL
jgi:hypothetical protein